jgi:hypothetical protein
MRWSVALAFLASAPGCETLVGITDKTVAPDSSSIGGADDAASKKGPTDGGGLDPSVPCARQPLPFVFCDDFDSVNSVSATWSWQSITPLQEGSIAFDTTEFTSAPRSAQVIAQPVVGHVQLGTLLDLAGATAFVIAFDLRIHVDTLAGVPQVALVQASAGNGIALNYVIGPGAACELQVYDQSVTPSAMFPSVTATLPPTRVWTRIVLAYDSAKGATVYEDGQIAAQWTGARPGPVGMSGFILGAAFVNPPGSIALTSEFDNVVIRVP